MKWSQDRITNALALDNPLYGELQDESDIREFEQWLEKEALEDRIEAMEDERRAG